MKTILRHQISLRRDNMIFSHALGITRLITRRASISVNFNMIKLIIRNLISIRNNLMMITRLGVNRHPVIMNLNITKLILRRN